MSVGLVKAPQRPDSCKGEEGRHRESGLGEIPPWDVIARAPDVSKHPPAARKGPDGCDCDVSLSEVEIAARPVQTCERQMPGS